jgi:glycosyltransferase involved in cell wall biosynthesis
VSRFDDILLFDGGSTDGTFRLAARYKARVLPQPQRGPIQDFSAVRNHMLQSVRHDWYLSLDADETASKELVDEIEAIVQNNEPPLVYMVPMGFMVRGRLVRYYSSYPGYQHRFFSRQSGAQYVKPIHEKIVFPKQRVGAVKGKWYIYWNPSREDPVVFNKYLQRDARFGADQPFLSFLHSKIYRNLRALTYIALYTLWARLFHPWRDCAPLRIEWLKMLYKIKHIVSAVRFRYSGA